MKAQLIFLIFILLILCGCSKDTAVNDPAILDVDFIWDLKHPERSPEIHLKNIPQETARLDIAFFDASNEWEHGGGSIAYVGSGSIAAGALKGFKGLSSTWGIPKIRLSVDAFDSNSRLVAKGVITKSPPNPE